MILQIPVTSLTWLYSHFLSDLPNESMESLLDNLEEISQNGYTPEKVVLTSQTEKIPDAPNDG